MAEDNTIRERQNLERYGVWVKTGPDDINRKNNASLKLMDIGDADQDGLFITEEEEKILGELEDSSPPDLLGDFDSVIDASIDQSFDEDASNLSDDSASMLQRIEGEIVSLRNEIHHLKDQLTNLDLPAKEHAAAPQQTAGFFSEEDDETIALTGDELDNILDSADMMEESSTSVDADSLSTTEISKETDDLDAGSEEVIGFDEVSEPSLEGSELSALEDAESIDLDEVDVPDLSEISNELDIMESDSPDLDVQEENLLIGADVKEIAGEPDEVSSQVDFELDDATEESEEADSFLESMDISPEDEEDIEEIEIDLAEFDESLETPPEDADIDLEEIDPDNFELDESAGKSDALADVANSTTKADEVEYGEAEEIDLEGALAKEIDDEEKVLISEKTPSFSLEEVETSDDSELGSLIDDDTGSVSDTEAAETDRDATDGIEISTDEISSDDIEDLGVEDESGKDDIQVTLPDDEFDELPDTEEVDMDSLEALIGTQDLTKSVDDAVHDMPAPEDESGTDEETLKITGSELSAESETDVSAIALSGDLQYKLKDVLQYIDTLLESLPEEKIKEFARNEHFETYKRIFEELGLSENGSA